MDTALIRQSFKVQTKAVNPFFMTRRKKTILMYEKFLFYYNLILYFIHPHLIPLRYLYSRA